uniref:Peptidase S1 domain-containing protein n=1 Tax=Strongyloides papillosus TaxID=174720 RepID=A0A0N5BQZ9_STREA
LPYYSIYEIGVKGTFKCENQRVGFATVLVSERAVDARIDRPITGTVGKYMKPFYLIGSVKSFSTPVLYATVLHNCLSINPQCTRLLVTKIPQKYIVRTGQRLNLFDLGIVNLGFQASNRTDCSRRRNSTLPLFPVLT